VEPADAVAAIAGMTLGVGASAVSIRAAPRLGLTAAPNSVIDAHRTPVAATGGLALVAATLAVLAAFAAAGHAAAPPGGMLAGLVLYAAMGAVDDARRLEPATKLLLQLAGAVAAAAAGARPAGIGYVAALALSVLLQVAVVNAFNLLDVSDAIAGSAFVASALVLLIGTATDVTVGAILVGATLGFLLLNAPPARLYLGDAGSHALGFALVVLAFNQAPDASAWHVVAVAGLAAAVPLFELLFVVAVRTRKRLPFWRGTPDHMALRLQRLGWSRGRIALAAGAASAACCTAGITMTGAARAVWATGLIAAAVAVWRYLLRDDRLPAATEPRSAPQRVRSSS
jgi:UDP-N-acetylmuramyl pentapeptide phosphotransferase/UDP-N-acetylglucosamine-1-phosphate transferase